MLRSSDNMVRRPRARRSPRMDNWQRSLRQLFSGISSVRRRTRSPEYVKTSRFALGRQTSTSFRSVLMRTTQSRSSTSPSASTSGLPLPSYSVWGSYRQARTEDLEQQAVTSFANRQAGERLRRRMEPDPKMRHHARNQQAQSFLIISCIILVFLLGILGAYLAVILTSDEQFREVNVILILCLLTLFVIFVYTISRYCLIKRKSKEATVPRGTDPIDSRGFANPSEPIPVTVARDEEAAGIASDTFRHPPPAYGLWRESVRADPNRLLWARNPAAGASIGQYSAEVNVPTTLRPPSYISEDGVDYVVSTVPRSIVSIADIPLQELRSQPY